MTKQPTFDDRLPDGAEDWGDVPVARRPRMPSDARSTGVYCSDALIEAVGTLVAEMPGGDDMGWADIARAALEYIADDPEQAAEISSRPLTRRGASRSRGLHASAETLRTVRQSQSLIAASHFANKRPGRPPSTSKTLAATLEAFIDDPGVREAIMTTARKELARYGR